MAFLKELFIQPTTKQEIVVERRNFLGFISYTRELSAKEDPESLHIDVMYNYGSYRNIKVFVNGKEYVAR